MTVTKEFLINLIKYHQNIRLKIFKRISRRRIFSLPFETSISDMKTIVDELARIEQNIEIQTVSESEDLLYYLEKHPLINYPQLKRIVKRKLNSTYTIFN